jgi:hypothetical protein
MLEFIRGLHYNTANASMLRGRSESMLDAVRACDMGIRHWKSGPYLSEKAHILVFFFAKRCSKML